jgi:tetratricopeptide (TPR) repeat protein
MARRTPTNPEREMPRPRKQSKKRPSPDALGDEAKSVLAVLAIAALWPARFEAGWVSVSQFGRYGLYLGDRTERESLKAAIRRALRDAAELTEPPVVDPHRTKERDAVSGRLLKDDDRRLREPIPLPVQLWVLRDGGRYLAPELWREFLATEYRPALSLDEVTASLEETVARTLLAQGEHDRAIDHARSALERAATARDRRPLDLVLSTGLMRRGGKGDWREALRRLEALARDDVPLVDHHDRVTKARILVTLGYARFFLGLRGEEPATEVHWQREGEIRLLLARATALTSDLSPADRGQIANLEGLLLKWEAQVERSKHRRQELFDLAERYLRQALTLWRLAHDAYSLGAGLYNLGELQFSRYQLHRGFGDEPEIREALLWYEASIHYTETLGTVREWYLDHAKAAECLCLLVPHLVGRGEQGAAKATLSQAASYIAHGSKHVASDSFQGRLFTRVGELLQRIRTQYLPPNDE